MIHFGIDTAGFDNILRCGTINFFDGWVANSDRNNPIVTLDFYIEGEHVGSIPVKRERPDLEKAFHRSLLGFYGCCDIPESCLNKNLLVYATAENGTSFFMQDYELKEILSQEQKDFRNNNLLPDDLLMHLVVHSVNPQAFLDEGKAGVEIIKSVLSENGIDLLSMKNILDFGVGCGRVLRWWQEYSRLISFSGCDINPELINWCKDHLNFGSFWVNPLLPPTIYKESQFDLIYLFSVFTHLTKETQQKWLDEFSRILVPGGILLVSVHGDFHAKNLPKEVANIYKKDGYYVMTRNAEGENLCASYQNRAFCEKLFSKHFHVLNYYPGVFRTCGYQDLYFLKVK